MTGDEEEARITFRIDEERKSELERQIHLAKAEKRLDEDVSKSDLLRRSVDQIIEDLKGNPKAATASS